MKRLAASTAKDAPLRINPLSKCDGNRVDPVAANECMFVKVPFVIIITYDIFYSFTVKVVMELAIIMHLCENMFMLVLYVFTKVSVCHLFVDKIITGWHLIFPVPS